MNCGILAPPARLERTTFRLGGGPSILVRYGGIYRKYAVTQGSRIRTARLLECDRSIQLSYGGRYKKYTVAHANQSAMHRSTVCKPAVADATWA